MTPAELATFEAAIISACAEHKCDYWEDGYWCCVVTQGYFVKFNSYNSLYPQVEMQKYISQCTKLDRSAPCVPKVLHFFHWKYQMAYMVMDYIKPTPTPVLDLPKRVALALQWLRNLPAPPGHVGIGPLGNSHTCHTLFKDCMVPLSFLSIQAVDRYMDQVCPCLYSLEHSLSANTWLGPGYHTDPVLVQASSACHISKFHRELQTLETLQPLDLQTTWWLWEYQ